MMATPALLLILISTSALFVVPGHGLPVTSSLSTWMRDVHNDLKDIPLSELAIPGSHNSGAYWIDENGPLASNQPDLVRTLVENWEPARAIIKKYSITQTLDVLEQLNHGVRHLDIRVAVFNGSFHVYHGFYGKTLHFVLQQVKQFWRPILRKLFFLV